MTTKDAKQISELMREAAQLLADISVQCPEATELDNWRWPMIDELIGSAFAMKESEDDLL